MKKAVFQTAPDKGGFIASFIKPVNAKCPPRFGFGNALLLGFLLVGVIALMRLLVAR